MIKSRRRRKEYGEEEGIDNDKGDGRDDEEERNEKREGRGNVEGGKEGR